MIKIPVNASTPYEVIIGRNILSGIGGAIKNIADGDNVMIVTDDNVAAYYLDAVSASVKAAGYAVCSYILAHGESNKNFAAFENIIDALAEHGFTRKDTVLALGGGVLGDIAGFAAGCYMRGIKVVQIPTTLLAAIDSSIGGKTGVDIKAGKNLAGVFHQPSLVYCDVSTFDTLPPSEFKNGIGEGIKYAVLCGGELMEILEKGLDGSNIERFTELCVGYKRDVVEEDETEAGRRKLLNLGHTVGHAVEKLSDYTVPHGSAVVTGISAVVNTALRDGELNLADAERINRLIGLYNFKVSVPYSKKELADAVKSDKKAENGGMISFISIRGIGDCVIKKIKIDELGVNKDEM